MAGFQLGNGTTLKVKHYFTNFHNEDFTETREVNGVTITDFKPYEGFKAKILQLSLGFALFQDESEAYRF